MGSKAQKQPLAGRNGFGDMRGRMLGNQDDFSSDADPTADAGVSSEGTEGEQDTAQQIPAAPGRMVERNAAIAVEAVARKYTPPDCKCCKGLRPDDPRTYTEVYSVHRSQDYTTRYIRCRYCGATSKDMEKSR